MKRIASAATQSRTYAAVSDRTIPVAKQKYVPSSGTYPRGFLAGTSHAGVKASNTKFDDVSMLVSNTPCAAGGVFTTNFFQAAPVQVCQSILRDRKKGQGIRGVLVNSGCANAVTGSVGLQHALEMSRTADDCFGGPLANHDKTPSTLVMSTGVIGQKLPMAKIKEAIPKAHASLGVNHEHWMKVAKAICTTDTFPKLLSRSFTLPSHPQTQYHIAGMTKGAGMIHPNMATLLAIICTDVAISQSAIHDYVSRAAETSFNSISIDGDTSTNDSCILLANGGASPPRSKALGPPSWANTQGKTDESVFLKVLQDFMLDLAKLVVRDGEGATKFITIRVQTNAGLAIAKQAANSIGTSALVKTALYGGDANWGRVVCALGYAPVMLRKPNTDPETSGPLMGINPTATSVSFVPTDGSPELKLLECDEVAEVDEQRAAEILKMEDLEILVKLQFRDRGREFAESVLYTCDFSHEYVTINGDYRT